MATTEEPSYLNRCLGTWAEAVAPRDLSLIPMIQLRTLGLLDLRDAEGREIRTVLQQPKRLGLLAYLSVATPRRFHRRDSLLALFWPDLDQEHARAALRRSLYFLRAELGADVLGGRGDEEVGVTEETLWCDATALERALDTGDFERTVELYRGPLLDGLHVAGSAPELPFLVRGDARYAYLAEGMVDLLATKLDGAGEVRTVDPRALLRFIGATRMAHRRQRSPRQLRGILERHDIW